MLYASTRKSSLFFITIFLSVTTCIVQANQELQSNSSFTAQELDFTAQPDFSDELDTMIDQFDEHAFEAKEPSRLVVFLRSVADPIVYYVMKFYNHTRDHFRSLKVKILAMLAANKRSRA